MDCSMPAAPGVYSNSYPWSQWCHGTISSSVAPFSSCLQFFPVSGSFPMSQFFASGDQIIGASISAPDLPMKINLTTQYIKKYSSTTSGIQKLASSEQARRVTGGKREWRWEMVGLQGHQQYEMEGKLQFHSHLTLMEHTFPSLKAHNLKVGM